MSNHLFISLIFISVLMLIFSQPKCREGENNCYKCNSITNLCFKCDNNYVFTPDENGGCTGRKKCEMGKNYCDLCDEENGMCKICSNGYIPDENGGCTYTLNCEISFLGRCLICKEGYELIGQNGGIQVCKIKESEDYKNCLTVNPVYGECLQCEEGYYQVSLDKKCIQTPNCELSLYGECIKCVYGYYLDHKDRRLCKSQYGTNPKLKHCKETEDGESCSKCDEMYYLDEEGNCVNTNFCEEYSVGTDGYCKKCQEGYFFAENGKKCVFTENCYNGDADTGICGFCKTGYYIDTNDGFCKSNQEDDDLKYCTYFTNKCTRCEDAYYLDQNDKCANTMSCNKSEIGVCTECNEGFFIGKDNHCSDIEHCIYSLSSSSCLECEIGMVFDKSNQTCIKADEDLANCKSGNENQNNTVICGECKENYYISLSDRKCYSNEEKGTFYKCTKTNSAGTECNSCAKGFFLGFEDKLCTTTEFCMYSEDHVCMECEEDSCLNVSTHMCRDNYYIEKEEDKIAFNCKRTNEDGTACEECFGNFTVSEDGYCVDQDHCEEKDENGVCIKCVKGNNDYDTYCLNSKYGCMEHYWNNNCLVCDNDYDFDDCTVCKDGFDLIENDLYFGEHSCEIPEN